MLLQAAEELGLDLAQSWMVGDSSRDIEAGQRAGCRTIRVRTAGETSQTTDRDDEGIQADFTVRNLVEAARIIVREAGRTDTWEAAKPAAAIATSPPESSGPSPQPAPPASEEGDEVPMDDSRVRLEILSHVRRLVRSSELEEFSFLKLAGGIVQMLALLTLLIAVIYVLGTRPNRFVVSTFWAVMSVALQTMALTFFTIQRNK
jgi:hypothetical protein